jgi:hypothetical protein
MLIQGRIRHALGEAIWKNRATPKAKFFVWLAVKGRIWTTERRFRHGLQDTSTPCEICLQEEETADHILLQCVAAREVWHMCRERLEMNYEEPTRESTIQEWWTTERSKLRGKERKDFDCFVCTTSHALWKNRNAWVFGDVRRQHRPLTLAALVAEEYNLIKAARVGIGVGVVGGE